MIEKHVLKKCRFQQIVPDFMDTLYKKTLAIILNVFNHPMKNRFLYYHVILTNAVNCAKI